MLANAAGLPHYPRTTNHNGSVTQDIFQANGYTCGYPACPVRRCFINLWTKESTGWEASESFRDSMEEWRGNKSNLRRHLFWGCLGYLWDIILGICYMTLCLHYVWAFFLFVIETNAPLYEQEHLANPSDISHPKQLRKLTVCRWEDGRVHTHTACAQGWDVVVWEKASISN